MKTESQIPTTNLTDNSCGCLNESPSVRTYVYEAISKNSKESLPDSYILPNDRLPDVENQGSINACVAFATAEILNILNKVETGEDVKFSEGFIYGYNRNETARYEGMYPQSTLDHMRNTGSVPKIYYDALYEMPEMRDKLLADKNFEKLKEISEKYRIKSYVGFLKGEKEEIKRALYEYKYPILGVSNFHFGESHAIIVIGWNKDGFIIQNSWGESWGDKGRGTVPLSAVSYAFLLIDEVIEPNFVDVKQSDWFYKAVKEAYYNGFMKGVGESRFDPNGYLSRAQAAQMIVNMSKKYDDVIQIMSNRISELEKIVSKLSR